MVARCHEMACLIHINALEATLLMIINTHTGGNQSQTSLMSIQAFVHSHYGHPDRGNEQAQEDEC